MLFGKPHSFLGVDLGAGGVKIVELKREKNRPALFTYGLTSEKHNVHGLLRQAEIAAPSALEATTKPPDTKASAAGFFTIDEAEVDHYAGILAAVCAEARTTSRKAVASLPVSAVFHALVTLPRLKRDDQNRLLNAEMIKLLPYPLEEMTIDSQILPAFEDDKEQKVVVNAVPRALVAFYTKVFKRAGLELLALEPESVALARSLLGRDAATTMIIDIGSERTNFFIIDGGVAITHHSIELGGERISSIFQRLLGIKAELTEQAKRDLFDAISEGNGTLLSRERFLALFSQIFEPLVKEIEYGFDLFFRQSGNENKRPEKIILSGGAARLPYLSEHLAQKFSVKCYLGDPWGRLVHQDSLKPILRAMGPRMAVAVGVALRNMV